MDGYEIKLVRMDDHILRGRLEVHYTITWKKFRFFTCSETKAMVIHTPFYHLVAYISGQPPTLDHEMMNDIEKPKVCRHNRDGWLLKNSYSKDSQVDGSMNLFGCLPDSNTYDKLTIEDSGGCAEVEELILKFLSKFTGLEYYY